LLTEEQKSYIYIKRRLRKRAIGHKAISYKAAKEKFKKAIGYRALQKRGSKEQ